jgi:quinol monooxygenase YgiN
LTSDPPAGQFPAVFTVYHAKPGLERALLQELRQLVRATRFEPGCVVFDLFRVTGGPETEKETYALYEVWESSSAKEGHQQAFHTRRFDAVASRQLIEPPHCFSLEELP